LLYYVTPISIISIFIIFVRALILAQTLNYHTHLKQVRCIIESDVFSYCLGNNTLMGKLMKYLSSLVEVKCLECDKLVDKNEVYYLRYPNDVYCSEKCGNKNQ
jgi:hypothetical protein